MIQFLAGRPASVSVVDHIDDRSLPAAPQPAANNAPVLSPGRGGIRVNADVAGATALLHGPKGAVLDRCATPCTFNNLAPAQYSLEVHKDGYQPVQTALQVRAGNFVDQNVKLESLTMGLVIKTRPAGATVWIGGAKQGGVTPLTLPLAPGPYDVVARLEGYERYTGEVQVKDNLQTTLDIELTARDESHVAWADVQSDPAGAEILVDGVDSGKLTPARLQIQAGARTITLRHPGFKPAKRPVDVSEGSTVNVNAKLAPR